MIELACKNRRITSCQTPLVSEKCALASGMSFNALVLDESVDAETSLIHGATIPKCNTANKGSDFFGLDKMFARACTVGGEIRSASAPKSSLLNRSRNIQISKISPNSDFSVKSGSIFKFGVMIGGAKVVSELSASRCSMPMSHSFCFFSTTLICAARSASRFFFSSISFARFALLISL